jgi:gamma-aminobutyric acid receptor subunit beta
VYIRQNLEYATVGYMAKRIQMRKQRFMAIQKIAEQKKLQIETSQALQASQAQAQSQGQGQGGGGSIGGDHGHGHGHTHSHGHQHNKQNMGPRQGGGMSNMQPNAGSRGCSIVGPLFQEVRFKVHDPKAHSKGGTLENTINGGRGGGGGPPQPPPPDEEAAAPPQHLIHPGKVSKKVKKIDSRNLYNLILITTLTESKKAFCYIFTIFY